MRFCEKRKEKKKMIFKGTAASSSRRHFVAHSREKLNGATRVTAGWSLFLWTKASRKNRNVLRYNAENQAAYM